MKNTPNNINEIKAGEPIRASLLNSLVANCRQSSVSPGLMDGARPISMWSKQSVEGVLVRNRTARVMEAFHVAALEEPVFPQAFPSTALSQNRVLSTIQPRGRKNDRERIVVYLEHCGQEGESLAVAEGLTACCIVFPEGDGVRLDDYRYARAVEAVTGYLEASRTSVGACARVVCRTEESVNIGEGDAQKTATWCYVIVTPEKDLIHAELFEPLYSWEKSGQTHVAPAKLYAPRVTRLLGDTPETGFVADIAWEEIDETVQICSPFDFGVDDDPLEAGTRVHARWDSSAVAWIAIRGGGGGSTPVTRLRVLGYAIGGMASFTGQDMQPGEVEGLPCFATDLAVQNPLVKALDTVAMKKDYPATYATLEGSGNPVAGVFISHPTHIRNQESSAEVTHSFCLDVGSHGGYHRFRFNNRFCIGRDDDYGTHFVLSGGDFSDVILYPSHQKINGQPYWLSRASDVEGIDSSNVWCFYQATDGGWVLSKLLGVPFWMGESQSDAFYRFTDSLPDADGQSILSSDPSGDNAVTLEFYYPRWQSSSEYGQYTPAGNLRSLELNASGTFYVGNPVWQTTFDGLSPTLTKSSTKHGDAYAWLAEENFESLENGSMTGDDNKWWEIQNEADILDRESFTLEEFYLDENDIKTATGRTAVYTFKEYAAAPAGEIQAVWLVTPEILSGTAYDG